MGIESNGDELKLYIRLPVKIVEEIQIKDLHPSIRKIWLPRQKSRRWCIVDFPDKDALEAAQKEIASKKINGRKIVVGDFKRPDRPKTNKKHRLKNETRICTFEDPLLKLLEQ